MILEKIQYIKNKGWSVQQFPELDSENTLVLIFASPEFINDQEPIKVFCKHYPKSKILGCSTAGEIFNYKVSDKTLSIAIIKFEKTTIKIAKEDISGVSESYHAGKKLAISLSADGLKGIFVLSEGLTINGSELVKGLNSLNKNDVIITGGLAGDGSAFKNTWVIFNGEIIKNAVVGVGFYGEHIRLGHGSKGGWDIFGVERRITKSKDNILYELDGKPALNLYKEYLGEKAAGLPATGLLFPLAIRKDQNDPKQLVRTILGIDEKDSALIFAGDMPQGFLAQLMRANFDRIISGATAAGKLVLEATKISEKEKFPLLIIAVSCVGRRLLLGERIEEETESVIEMFPAGTKQIGFYSYGEISPHTIGTCDLHNQTMTITSISEEV